MNLAIAIICLWLGSMFLWVATHGLDDKSGGFSGLWGTVLSGIGGGQ